MWVSVRELRTSLMGYMLSGVLVAAEQTSHIQGEAQKSYCTTTGMKGVVRYSNHINLPT